MSENPYLDCVREQRDDALFEVERLRTELSITQAALSVERAEAASGRQGGSMNEETDIIDRLETADRELEEARAESARLAKLAHQAWCNSPAFATFAELKHGPAGQVLQALQDGSISRGRAAEALAEIFHGATEARLPKYSCEFSEDEEPGETVRKLRDEAARLAAALEKQPCGCHRVFAASDMSAEALESGAASEVIKCKRCAALTGSRAALDATIEAAVREATTSSRTPQWVIDLVATERRKAAVEALEDAVDACVPIGKMSGDTGISERVLRNRATALRGLKPLTP